jgi:hypothetical protein
MQAPLADHAGVTLALDAGYGVGEVSADRDRRMRNPAPS